MEEQLHNYFQGKLDIDERLVLLRAIESDQSLRRQFVEIKNVYAFLSLADQRCNDEESRKSYDSFIRRKGQHRVLTVFVKISGYVAAAVLFFLLSYWIALNQIRVSEDTTLLSLHVPAGQRLRFTLQDGTSVWLNSRSTLSYPVSFTGGERRVMLEGEAYFEVAKDADRPFIVSSQDAEMKVLGTTFNVYSYPETGIIKTSLLEGSLLVYYKDKEKENTLLKPNEQVTLRNGGMEVEQINDKGYFLWTEGIYSFSNEPLDNILRKLEIYFDIEIVVKDPTIYTWEYTGKFRQRDGIDEILRIINKIHKFKIEKDEENNRIILSR
ncbi:MAG: FecR domain-containing protein [Massilibacteroides sp.]|nr:FecR domain-containing protein [Massilibacteroides sp.]